MLLSRLMRSMRCRCTIYPPLLSRNHINPLGFFRVWIDPGAGFFVVVSIVVSSQSSIGFRKCHKHIGFHRFVFPELLQSIEHIHRMHFDNAPSEARNCGYSPGFADILHFWWRPRRGIGIAVLRLHGVHNAEVASISENVTKTNWFLTILGLVTASNRSQVGQLQIWKSHCRSGNSNIFVFRQVIFIILSDAV